MSKSSSKTTQNLGHETMGCTDNETFASIFCEYKSIRFIRVRNVKLSCIYYIAMALVLVYVVAYTIILEKGYQSNDTVTGTTSVKLKGRGAIGDENGAIEDLVPLDSMDLVQPSMEENAFFVVTSMTITPNQTRQLDCDGNTHQRFLLSVHHFEYNDVHSRAVQRREPRHIHGPLRCQRTL